MQDANVESAQDVNPLTNLVSIDKELLKEDTEGLLLMEQLASMTKEYKGFIDH